MKRKTIMILGLLGGTITAVVATAAVAKAAAAKKNRERPPKPVDPSAAKIAEVRAGLKSVYSEDDQILYYNRAMRVVVGVIARKKAFVWVAFGPVADHIDMDDLDSRPDQYYELICNEKDPITFAGTAVCSKSAAPYVATAVLQATDAIGRLL